MDVKMSLTELLPKTINYWFARKKFIKATRPITLTFSVTGMCQSMCKTCHIGTHFHDNPEKIKKLDLKIEEIEKFFKSLGYTYFLNISGGEPYLRNDLVDVIEIAMQYLKPKIVHIPTNAFLPEKIEKVTVKILDVISQYNAKTPLTVKPSVDGIEGKHDEIRGLKGNFKRLGETIRRLKAVEKDYSNFHLELGTVVSNFNIADLDEIEDWVQEQGVQTYRNEIAEQREEFFNIGEEITPSHEVYEKLMINFKDKIKKNLINKRSLTKITESMRLIYYELAVKILREKRQVLPCYAGISNIHLNYDGDVWPCCVLGYRHSMGNIRGYDFDYDVLYDSPNSKAVRRYIKDKNCYCPLANQAYSNMLMSVSYLMKISRTYFEYTQS